MPSPASTASRSAAAVTCITRSAFSRNALWNAATIDSASRSEPSGCTLTST